MIPEIFLKVVLLHDWLTGYRGGERVLEAFCEMFPEAPLYTLIHKPGSVPAIIENRKIVTSFLNRVPAIDEHYRKFLPLFPLAAQSLRITEDAEIVLSSSHCVIKGVRKPANAKHFCYIHSPMRYMYDQFPFYFGKECPLYQRSAAHLLRPLLQAWDRSSNQNVDLFCANSEFVKERVHQFYNRDAMVIHPFVELEDFLPRQLDPPAKEDFYLMVTAFAPNKRVDLAIDAFNRSGKQLKIIGSGQQEKQLRAMAGTSIEFLGNLSRDEVIDHYFRARGFIFPGIEDFGITPLESLAAGTPLIAYHKGGVLETQTEQTAHFFYQQTVEALEQAITEFENRVFFKEVLLERAREFSRESFKERVREAISGLLTTSTCANNAQ